MRAKRGMMPLELIVAAIPLLILLGFLLYFMFNSQTAFGASYNKMQVQANERACLAQAGLAATVFDNDFGRNQGDGYPDSCDICLGGDDNKDSDGDGIPDACDDDRDNPPKKGIGLKQACEHAKGGAGKWNEARQQCMLPCYPPLVTQGVKNGIYPCKRDLSI
jgi:hypothetical protein